jgi:hypothetical protein
MESAKSPLWLELAAASSDTTVTLWAAQQTSTFRPRKVEAAGPGGKGRNVWTCFGYVLASEQARMVAVHDCDILTYHRELLTRLCYPLAHPALGFDFCKGYYARVTQQLNGRVMRLLVTPLLRALERRRARCFCCIELMATCSILYSSGGKAAWS